MAVWAEVDSNERVLDVLPTDESWVFQAAFVYSRTDDGYIQERAYVPVRTVGSKLVLCRRLEKYTVELSERGKAESLEIFPTMSELIGKISETYPLRINLSDYSNAILSDNGVVGRWRIREITGE